jgi:hypothetical protein
MCDLCVEYLKVAEAGRALANERDRLVVATLEAGDEPPFLEVPQAPQRPKCKDKP